MGVSLSLQGWWSELRALSCGKNTSCSPKKAQICVCTQLSLRVCEKCSETAVVMAQCRGSGWTNTEIKTKLTDVFQVQFFGSYAFPRQQYKSVYFMCGSSSVFESVKMVEVTQAGRITSYYHVSFTQF